MKKENFQVDGVGINAAHYQGFKEADFVADIFPAIPAKFGGDAQKKEWAKKAYEIMVKTFPVEKQPVPKKVGE